MSEPLTLDLLDKEGAIRDALDEGSQGTRAELFRRAVAGGGTVLAGGLLIGGLPQVALGKPSAKQDAAILNFALLLEYLESEFYVDAVNRGALSGATLAFATTVRDHELAHVQALQGALGSAAIAKPTFDFKGTTSDAGKFVATAMVLEDTGVAAYNGQGPRLRRRTPPRRRRSCRSRRATPPGSATSPPGPTTPPASGRCPAPVAFDPALSKSKVEAAVGATGFITG